MLLWAALALLACEPLREHPEPPPVTPPTSDDLGYPWVAVWRNFAPEGVVLTRSQ